MNEREIQDKVVSYLEEHGFSWADIKQQPQSEDREVTADILVTQQNKPYAVIEIKRKLDLGNLVKAEWSFHSAVRQAQQIALAFKAPFFATTDGEHFFWFTHSTTGRPETLEVPFKPIASTYNDKKLDKEFCRNILESFRTFTTLFHNEEILSQLLYAQLLATKGNSSLKKNWLSGKNLADSHYRQESEKEILDIFERLDHTDFFQIDPAIISDSIDEVFSTTRKGLGIPKWLAEFLWLAGTSGNPKNVLAGSVDFPQLQSVINAKISKPPRYTVEYFYRHRNNLYWYKLKQALFDLPEENLFEFSTGPWIRNGAQYDTILLAPVFGVKVENLSNSKFSVGRDIDFSIYLIEQAIKSITSTGKVLSFVPESILFSDSYKSFRQYLVKQGLIHAVLSLPIGAFHPFSGIKSSLLVLGKANRDEIIMVEPKYALQKNSDFKKILKDLEKIASFDSTASSALLNHHRAFSVQIDQLREYRLNVSAYALADAVLSENEYPLVPLSDISHTIFRGIRIKISHAGTSRVVGPGAIRALNFRTESVDFAHQEDIPRNAKRLEENDVVVNAIGTHRAESTVVSKEFAGAPISQHLIAIRPNTKYVIPEYLALLLNSSRIKSYLLSSTGTTVIASISLTILKDLQLPLPPLESQKIVLQEFADLESSKNRAEEQFRALERKYFEFIDRVSDNSLNLD